MRSSGRKDVRSRTWAIKSSNGKAGPRAAKASGPRRPSWMRGKSSAGEGKSQAPSMGADVGEAVERSAGIPCEQQRLVHASLEERERQDRAGGGHLLCAVDELPAAREDLLSQSLEDCRVAVKRRGKGPGTSDVFLDHVGSQPGGRSHTKAGACRGPSVAQLAGRL